MGKRAEYSIMQKFLLEVKEKEATYAELERSLNTGNRTVKKNATMLEALGQVSIRRIEKHPSNGRESYLVKISDHGLKSLERMKARDKRTSSS
jgi:predicted transcriptional regulator